MRTIIRGAMALGVAVSMSACLDLDVTNENEPERERALSNPADVEGIMGVSAFRAWYDVLHGYANVTLTFGIISDESTNTVSQMGVQWSQEPRQAFINDELASQVWLPRHPYDNFSECIANINDTMGQINGGMRILTSDAGGAPTDNTDRAVAWGKLWQGVCIGYLANTLDRFPLATEDTVLPAGWEALSHWERDRLQDEEGWKDALPVAIATIEAAIEKAESSAAWTTPTAWVPGQSYTNQQVIQLAHTLIARILIYSARYPEERAALDWDKVLFHTERGLTYDFGPVLAPSVITDGSYLFRLLSTSSTTRMRADYRTIGWADQSGKFQTWLQTQPPENADRFTITTPDRRITGTQPTYHGAYFRYQTATSSAFDVSRGLQHNSYYQYWRHIHPSRGTGFDYQNGFYPLVTKDENTLYRAEAMLRKNRPAEAATLINVTRTRGQYAHTGTSSSAYTLFPTNLPPVTAAGVPEVSGVCVPRKASGACGDLWDALMYERGIELYGLDPMRGWMDRRGFGQLQPGTWVQLPVPARYLTSLGVAKYTFGGVGGNGAAK